MDTTLMPELELPPGEESWIFSWARNARWVSDQLLKHDAADERLDKLISEEAKLNWERFSENRSLAQSTADTLAPNGFMRKWINGRLEDLELKDNSIDSRLLAIEDRMKAFEARAEQDYVNQLKRIKDLSARVDHLELNASEPVADRTRGRKHVKQDRVTPRVLSDARATWPLW